MNPPIVVNAFKRPQSLKRLLSSLAQADIPANVDLIFSLEGGAPIEVQQLTEQFNWPFGTKQVLIQPVKLGLINHYLHCLDITKRYGAIVYLEDDLFVGRAFYLYALQVLKHYSQESRIAGFSLNSLWFNGYLHTPFKPVDDGGTCFYFQTPWYQGQVYTAQQVIEFESWFVSRKRPIPYDLMIHETFRHFSDDEWFPIKTQYLIETDKYYCFPRISHCVNFGDTGTHFKTKTDFFQTELALNLGAVNMLPFDESVAVYDSFYEIIPDRFKRLALQLAGFDLTIDLNGQKPLSLIKTDYLLTIRRSNKPIQQFALEMRPPELNIIYRVGGNSFYSLTEVKDVKDEPIKLSQIYRLFQYHYRFKLRRKTKLYLVLQWTKSLFR
jgi:hypothetical protein